MKILLLFIPLLFVSCIQEEKLFTLNPDGSGKVEFKVTLPIESALQFNTNAEDKSPEQKAKDAVTRILEDSEGVAAWSDVSYKINAEGKVEFQGTAYFSDVNKLKLKSGMMSSDTLKPTLTSKDGVVTVQCELAEDKENANKPQKKKPKWADMTETEKKAAMAKARQGLMQMKGMLSGIAGDMSSKVTIRIPAAAKESKGFEKLTDSSFTIKQTGEMMLKGIEKVMADEKIMQSIAGEFDMNDEPPAEILEAMFGFSDNPSVSFAANAPVAFDYKKELLAAQKAAPEMMQKLGLTVEPTIPMTGESEFKSFRLAGVRVVGKSKDRDVRPFNWTAGTALAFIGELPGAVISADEGKIKTFTLNNGQNLLSSKTWDHKPRSIDLSDDGTVIGFEVHSDQLPETGATSIKLLEGEVVCMAASSSKSTDLEFAKIEKGEKSKHYGAEITKLEDSKYNKGKKELSIQLELDRNLIKGVKIFDKDGIQLKSERNGYSWSGKSSTLRLLCDGSLSSDCRVELELHTDLKKHVLPFKIENTPLIPVVPKK